MCGLAGVHAKYINDKHRKIFQELMLGASLRGMHSAGVAAVFKAYNAKDADYTWDKCVGGPLGLFERKGADTVLKTGSCKALIGHCRSATIGSISRSNAHPFQTDSRMMIGCHNGTIRGVQRNEKFYGTDSECLLNNIDEEGIEKTLAATSGAWALTYFDCKDNTLNLIRNSERTLYVASVVKDNELFWTSEEGLLKWILDRNNVKYDEIVLLKPDTLVSIDVTKEEPLAKTSVKFTEVKGKEESRTAASTSHFPGVRQQVWDRDTQSWKVIESPATTSETRTETTTARSSNGSSVETKENQTTGQTSDGDSGQSENTGTVVGTSTAIPLTCTTYGGKKVSRARFQEILNMGCLNCEKVKRVGDEVHFFADNVYLCQECNDIPMVRECVNTKVGEYICEDYETVVEEQFQVCN